MDGKLVAMVFKSSDNDYTVWIPDGILKDPRFLELLKDYETDGCSVRGTKDEVLAEI